MSDICYILDEVHLVAKKLEISSNQVREKKGPQIANMRIPIDGGTTTIHSDPISIRFDGLDLSAQRVVNTKLL